MLERRLAKLETLVAGTNQQEVIYASHSIEVPLRWPCLSCRPGEKPDTDGWYRRITTNHQLDAAGWRSAVELALSRMGASRDEAREIATLPLLELMELAASRREEATR